MASAMPNCLRLLAHTACWALRLVAASAGSSNAAYIAMMAMTTNSSIKVNPA
jgi:hypothetical protein